MAVKSVHLQQLKGIQSSKLGSQRGTIYFVNRGYGKRYLFCRKYSGILKGKVLYLEREPLRINFAKDLPSPPPKRKSG